MRRGAPLMVDENGSWITLHSFLEFEMKMSAFGFRVSPWAITFALAGCANPSIPLYQSTIAGRAAIQATTPLVADGSVPPAVGADVEAAGSTTYAALIAWNDARLSGDNAALAAATAAAGAALGVLETRLAELQAANPQSRDQKAVGSAARTKLQGQLRAPRGDLSTAGNDGTKKVLSPEVILAIIDLAVTEMPALVDWINRTWSATAVTNTQIQTELDGMAADLEALESAINGRR